MSRDDRDKAGGHALRKSDMYACECCPRLSPPERSTNRRRRNRAAERFEQQAEGTS